MACVPEYGWTGADYWSDHSLPGVQSHVWACVQSGGLSRIDSPFLHNIYRLFLHSHYRWVLSFLLAPAPAAEPIETSIRITYNCTSVLSPVFGEDFVVLSVVLVTFVALAVFAEDASVSFLFTVESFASTVSSFFISVSAFASLKYLLHLSQNQYVLFPSSVAVASFFSTFFRFSENPCLQNRLPSFSPHPAEMMHWSVAGWYTHSWSCTSNSFYIWHKINSFPYFCP